MNDPPLMRPDEVEQIAARQHVDRVLAELTAARRSGSDEATLRQLALVRLSQLDEVEVVELLLLASWLYDERALRNVST